MFKDDKAQYYPPGTTFFLIGFIVVLIALFAVILLCVDGSNDATHDFYNHDVDMERYYDGKETMWNDGDNYYAKQIDDMIINERAMGHNVTLENYTRDSDIVYIVVEK